MPSASTPAELRWAAGGEGAAVRFEAVFARDASGGGVLRISKGLGAAILTARLLPGGQAELRTSGPAWRGQRAHAPSGTAPLFALLALYVSEPDLPAGQHEIHTAQGLRVVFEVVRGGLATLSATDGTGATASARLGIRP